MSKQYAIATIQFQANARQANSAIDSLRVSSSKANEAVTRLKKEMSQGLTVGKYNGEELPIAQALKKAKKDARDYESALKDLTKGAQAFESVVKNIRTGKLEENNAAELKSAIKAAELRISRLRETDKDYGAKRADLEKVIEVSNARMKELTANSDAFFQKFRSGVQMNVAELEKEKKALIELQAVQDSSAAYKRIGQQIAEVDARIRQMGGDYKFVRENITDTKKVSDEMLAGMLKSLQQVNAEGNVTKKTLRENAAMMREVRAEQTRRVQNVLGGDLGKQKGGDIRNAITLAKELVDVYGTNSKKAQELSVQIVNAEEHLKTHGVEAARAAQREKAALEAQAQKEKELHDLMTKRMSSLHTLTEGGLAETKKYWQAQMDGAAKSSKAYKEAERNLKQITAEEERLNKARLQQSANKLNRKNLSTLSEQEITDSVKAAKQLAASMKPTEQGYKTLTDNIIRAEEHVKKFGLEGQRSSHQVSQKLQEMRGHMDNLNRLSAAALEETRKYWQAQQDGATKGSKAYKEATANLKVIAVEQERVNKLQLQQSADKLGRKNLGTLQAGDLQTSINSAKQLLLTLKPTSAAYKELQNNVLRAEEFQKKYSLETARSNQQAAQQMQMMGDRMKNVSSLSISALEETRKFWQAQMEGAERGSKAYATAKANMEAIVAEQQKLTNEQNKAQANKLMGGPAALSSMGAGEIQKAIEAAKQYQLTLKADSQAYKDLSVAIVNADEHVKKYGVEAVRAARKEEEAVAEQIRKEEQLKTTMNGRLSSLMSLSTSALAETKKFWQAQMDGAARGSQAYKEAEAALKRITEQERTRTAGQATRVLSKPGSYGDAEIRQAIQAMEQLRDAQAHGSPMWEQYNKRVQEGKRYLDEWAKTDSIVKFEGQMAKLPTLSDAALAETKKFWETMVAGADKGTKELAEYEAHLQRVKQEERERRQLSNEQAVQTLSSTNLGKHSEEEIRRAIEAGKQLIQTYETASPEAQKLAENIVRAERHLEQYGVSAVRSAQREKDAIKKAAEERRKNDQMMEQQLQKGSALTKEALKAQEQYWQRLINDPKTASSSLAQYQANLDKVRLLQKMMMQQAGGDALAFFRGDTSNASAAQIQEQAAALKLFRDSLPKKANADLIKEIDGYLVQAGQAAKKAAADAMTFKQALQVGKTAGTGSFRGTVEQLTQAKKVLEDMSAKAVKGGLAWRRIQEALQRINIELKNVGHISQEVQAVLDNPKGRSFNQLKQAVEQGRVALNAMDRTTKEGQKAFDELAKKIKAADLEMKTLGNSAKGTVSAFDKAWSRLKTYIGLYMGAAVAIRKLMSTLGDIMTLSDKMGEVRKTTGFTADEVGRLSDNLRSLDVRTSLTSLMDTAAKAGQLGLKTEQDVMGFTEAANKMMIALPEMGQEAATEIMKVATATGEVDKIRRQMQDGLIEGSSATAVAMEKVASTIDQLRANSAAAAPAITDFVKRVGAVGAQSGISIDQVAALGATVDALGLRVEMSATALSRMIPAIRNNAFNIAKTIGVTPEAIRQLFDAGRGMDVILMIFQHIKEAGLDEDSIESMLGMAGMKDIMKELNQMGARAGIVFAGLSQNVEELRKNLGIAGEAYEENMAIQREFDKMNDTTAARWERLKNQIEESFVSNNAQKFFGWLIDGLRWIVDFMTGNLGPTMNYVSNIFKTFLVMWGAFKIGLGEAMFVTAGSRIKSLGQSIALTAMYTKDYIALQWQLAFAHGAAEKAAIRQKIATIGVTKAMKANVIMAVVAALGYLAIKWWENAHAISATDKAFADLEQEYNKQINTVDTLFHKVAKLREQERLSAEQAKATAEAEKQKAEAVEQAAKAEHIVADTTKIITDSIKAETVVTDSLKKSKENLADTTSILNNGLVAEAAVTDSLEQSKKKLAEVSEILNGGTLKEVVVTGSLEKSKRKLAEATKLLDGGMLAEVVVTGSLEKSKKKLAEATDIINGGMLKEVVVTGSLEKSKRKLAETTDIINGGMLQEVVVTGSLEKSKRNLANTTATLNGGILQEVVVTGSLEKSKRKLAEATKLLDGGMLAEVVVTGSLEKSKKKLAEATDIINGGMLKEVVVTGSLEKSKRKLAEVSKILDGGMLQEVVVTGSLEKAKRKLAEATDIINGGMLQEIVVTGSLEKSKKKLAETTEILDGGMLQEVVVTGSLEKSKKNLTEAIDSFNKGLKQAVVSEDSLKKSDKELTDSVGIVTKSTQAATDATSKLSEKSEELAKQSTKVEEGMHRVNIEGAKSADIIRTINSKYGTYLGYMLSETTSAQQLAAARELINKKLRETITLKQQEAALGTVESEYGGKVNKKASSMDKRINEIFGSNYDAAARVSVAISEAAQKYAKDQKAYEKAVEKILRDNSKYIDKNNQRMQELRDSYGSAGISIDKKAEEKIIKGFTSDIMSEAKSYREAVETYQDETAVVNRRFEAANNINRKETQKATVKDLNAILGDWKDLVSQYKKAEGEQKEKLAVEVYKQQRAYANAYANNSEYFGQDDGRRGVIERQIGRMKDYEKGLREVAGEAIKTVDAMERADSTVLNTNFTNNNNNSQDNPWGGKAGADSTNYKDMAAEVLVERRKQMKDFVNAIQTDTDVQSVLKEDAALKKAIENGMSSDMRTVIEWYNTERLKIQDELHARHLTNTGDWMDPKKQKSAHKQFQNEIDAYLHELDAYYTERKTRIEEAGTDEGLTEAEIKNRTLANEMEWRQRRAELQKLYARRSAEVTEEEQQAIYHIIAERTGDSEKFVEGMIQKTNQFVKQIEQSGEKGAAIVHDWLSKLGLELERDYLRQQQALTKQMKAIEAIIDKERPFNGITKSLRENLATMDILTGDMRKEYDELMKKGADMKDFNERQAAEELRRTTFMLGEAENAYSTTIESVMARMREKGMTAWADWLQVRPEQQEATMAQLRQTYDQIQDAIKKEASQLKKQAEIMWNNILLPGGDGKTTLKQALDQTVAQLGIDQGRVSRANSLIGAGAASERVADRLAIKQMQLQLRMQEHYYNLMKKQGQAHVDMLNQQADAAERRGDAEEATRKRLDAQHAAMSLNLATSKEETELAKQREEIIAKTEESQNRLYTSLKEWGDLLAQSLQSLFEASNAGNAEYYNELAKLDLTGKGGPGAGTYIVIDNEGTSDAKAHYEYLDERQALERQHEIEQENARAEAWRKVMDDLNAKMNDQITDWMNAALQDAATRENTAELKQLQQKLETEQQKLDTSVTATNSNTDALKGLTQQLSEGITIKPNGDAGGNAAYQSGGNGQTINGGNMDVDENDVPNALKVPEETASQPGYTSPWQQAPTGGNEQGEWLSPMQPPAVDTEAYTAPWAAYAQASTDATKKVMENDKKAVASTQSSFAKMTLAANLYGIAYQTMSNDNLSTTQKFEMMALQAVGNYAIGALTTEMAAASAKAATDSPGVLGTLWKQLGWAAAPVFAIFTGLLGGLMGLATSKISKAKSTIAQATGSSSASAGRLATGMLTYAEGNVNEFTDPSTLTPGRQYNVDAADGRTYRARYMGTNPRTHITNGPEFHLSGERGREMIIDAGTTRQITMNEAEIWHAIQTLSTGGTLRRPSSLRRRGIAAHADGNLDEFDDVMGSEGMDGMGTDLSAIQSSLDRNSAIQEALLERLNEPIVAQNILYGPDGLPNILRKLSKQADRHGEKYL